VSTRPGADRLRVLYLCYLSLDDPLVETQVVAYLERLAERGHTIHLLTWEVRRQSRTERQRIRERLRGRGIHWHRLRYHKRLSLLATAFDSLSGIVVAFELIRRHRLVAVHARSHIPAFMGLALRRLTGARLIFDIRGLLAQEYVDAGNWRAGSTPVRLVEWVQRRAIERAAATVTLTERVARNLFGPPPWPSHWIIPCCANVEELQAQSSRRDELRARLGLADQPVLVYVGKFGGWYLQREMVDLFAVARERMPDLHFLVLTQSDKSLVESEFARAGVEEQARTIARVDSQDVGAYLGAADFAISFIRPAPSKISSSPTKVGEYLAVGLPVLCAAGVGDLDDFFTRTGTGVLLEALDRDSYLAASDGLLALAGDPDTPRRCKQAARDELSLDSIGTPRYDALYSLVANS